MNDLDREDAGEEGSLDLPKLSLDFVRSLVPGIVRQLRLWLRTASGRLILSPAVGLLAWGAAWWRRHGGDVDYSGLLVFVAIAFTLALLVVSFLTALKLLVQKRDGWAVGLATIGFLFLTTATLFFGSMSFKKSVALDENLPSRPSLCQCLGSGEWALREAPAANVITAVGDRVCGQDNRGAHLVIAFEWLLDREPRRKYAGEFVLLGKLRTAAGPHGEWTVVQDPFELRDYSVAPLQGWRAYAFGWWDEMALANQRNLVIDPVNKRVKECEAQPAAVPPPTMVPSPHP